MLKDVAQKFEAFGKEASVYFEGRARLLSVIVAMALAFLAHVDAVDLFKTYLRDPNARAKVIEQTEAVTAQYKAAEKNDRDAEQFQSEAAGRCTTSGRFAARRPRKRPQHRRKRTRKRLPTPRCWMTRSRP